MFAVFHPIFIAVFLFALLSQECSRPQNYPRPNIGFDAGPFALDMSVDREGKVSFEGSLTPIRLGLGPFAVRFGLEQTLFEAKQMLAQNDYQNLLIVMVEDANGTVRTEAFEVGKPFQANCKSCRGFELSSEGSNVFIVLKNAQSYKSVGGSIYSSSTNYRRPQQIDSEQFAVVDTLNDSGLEIREQKNNNSPSKISVPDGEQIEILSCDSEISQVKARRGNWCRVKYGDVEGYGFGPYFGKWSEYVFTRERFESTGHYAFRARVDTEDGYALPLRTEKDLDSDWTVEVPQKANVNVNFCEEELVTVKGQLGRWCQVDYQGDKGWAWGFEMKEISF